MYLSQSRRERKIIFLGIFCYFIFTIGLLFGGKFFSSPTPLSVHEVRANEQGYFGKFKPVEEIIKNHPTAREVKFRVKSRKDAEALGLLNMKKFSTGNYSNKYIFFPGEVNYVDEATGEVVETEPVFELQPDGTFRMSRASYHAQAPAFADEEAEFSVDNERVSFAPLKLNTTTIQHIPAMLDGTRVVYPDAFGSGVDYILQAEPDELRKLVVFREPPKDLSQDIRIEFQTSLKGKATLRGRNTQLGSIFFRQPTVWDNSGAVVEPITVELNGGVLTKIIPKSFFERPQESPLSYPVTTDVTTSYYSGAGDGRVYYSTGSQSWATAHAETGDNNVVADYTGITIIAGSRNDSGGAKMYRGFIPIDTSGIADNDEITAARLKVYATSTTSIDAGDGNDYVVVVKTSAASTSSLTGEDYDQCGSVTNPTPGSATLTIGGSITLNSYNTLTLNSTGEEWISVTSTTQLGLREGHDAVNDTLTGVGASDLWVSASEVTGTSQDPVLEVDTTAAVISSVTTQRTIFATNTANIIVSSSITGETRASSTLEYVLFLDEDSDATPDTNETYVTGDCASSAAWSSGAYTYIKSNFTIGNGESPKTHSWECANTNFPENGKYTIYLTWKDANGTIDTDSAATFQSCDQPTSTNNWADTSYANRVILNFRSSTFSEALLEFPVLVKATSTNFGFDDPDTSANDVTFIDGIDDGQAVLTYEREYYDSTTTKEGYWWVKVPKIATSTDCDYIQMYYDNAGAVNISSSTGPWRDDYYEAVWHFGENATATSYSFQDGVSPTAGYAGTEDLNLESGTPTTNQNGDTSIMVDYLACAQGAAICRALMQWDISTISSCTVGSASITVTVTNGTADRYSVYALRQNWTETGATWNTYDGTNSWTIAGASSTVSDFYNTDLMDGNSDTGFGRNTTGALTFDFDSDGITAIQDWINGTVTNNGLLFRDTYFAGPPDDDGFAWDYRGHATAGNHPKLTITCGTDSTYLDSTSKNHDETNSSIASRNEKSASKFGYSPKFDGSASVLGIPDSAGFDMASYTITGWLYRQGAGDPVTFSKGQTIVPIIAKGYAEADTAAADIQFALGVDNGGATYLGANFEDNRNAAGNDWAMVGGKSIQNSVWYHVGYRVKAAAYITLYMDGFRNNSTTYPLTQTPSTGGTHKVGIGTAYNTGGFSDGKWQGYLDEIRVYKVALSTSTASDESVWLRAEWYTADNGYVEWGTEATNTTALSITASTSLAFPTANYSFYNQTSTATLGGINVVGVGNWNLNLSCADNPADCTWRGNAANDRFTLYKGNVPTSTASSSGVFCFNGEDGGSTPGISCLSVSGDACTTITLTDKKKCYQSDKADITIAIGASADGTFWIKEIGWLQGIPGAVTAGVYTTTLTFDLQ